MQGNQVHSRQYRQWRLQSDCRMQYLQLFQTTFSAIFWLLSSQVLFWSQTFICVVCLSVGVSVGCVYTCTVGLQQRTFICDCVFKSKRHYADLWICRIIFADIAISAGCQSDSVSRSVGAHTALLQPDEDSCSEDEIGQCPCLQRRQRFPMHPLQTTAERRVS